ncbi:hypothetical protein Droror1_Dr00012087 [Drosera rotundifolia]
MPVKRTKKTRERRTRKLLIQLESLGEALHFARPTRGEMYSKAGPPFVPSDPLVGERIEGLLGLSPSIRAISPFPVERHPSNATGSNCFTSPSTAGVASKGKLFISSNTCGSISPAIRSNYWIWATASKPVEAKVQSNKLSLRLASPYLSISSSRLASNGTPGGGTRTIESIPRPSRAMTPRGEYTAGTDRVGNRNEGRKCPPKRLIALERTRERLGRAENPTKERGENYEGDLKTIETTFTPYTQS